MTDTDERDIVIETDGVRAVFTNRGAALKSWRLKRFQSKAGKPVDLGPADPGRRRQAVLVVTGDAARRRPRQQRALRVDGGGAGARPEDRRLRRRVRVSRGRRPGRAQDVRDRRLEVHHQRRHRRERRAARRRTSAVLMGPSPGDARDRRRSASYVMGARAMLYRERSSATTRSALLTMPAYEAPMRYAGVDDHYFMSAALLGTKPARIDYQPLRRPGPDGKPRAHLHPLRGEPAGPGREHHVLPRAEGVRPAQGHRRRVRARHRLRHVRRSSSCRCCARWWASTTTSATTAGRSSRSRSSSTSPSSRCATRAWCRCGRCRSCSPRSRPSRTATAR